MVDQHLDMGVAVGVIVALVTFGGWVLKLMITSSIDQKLGQIKERLTRVETRVDGLEVTMGGPVYELPANRRRRSGFEDPTALRRDDAE